MSSFLVERDSQLSDLADHFSKSLGGLGNITLISGAPGSGKTVLMRSYIEDVASPGAIVLSAITSRVERDLPFGVLHQLFQSRDLPTAIVDRTARIFQHAATDQGSRGNGPLESIKLANVFEGLRSILVDLADEIPLIITVDDLQHSDIPSMKFIHYLARRIDASRIFIVLTESNHLAHSDPIIYTELVSQPNFHRIRLAPLTQEGVAALLSRQLDLDSKRSRQLSEKIHRITDGNPLLVNGLISDYSSIPNPGFVQVIPGEAFHQAIVALLHRSRPVIHDLARTIAILDAHVSPPIIAEMLEIDIEATLRAIAELEMTGLTESYRFRHESIRNAIRGHMTPYERAAAHSRAARVLHAHDAPSTAQARHLLAADWVDPGWAGPTLLEATHHALADGQFDTAIHYLRKAYDACSADPDHAATKSAIVRAEWRIDPSIATRHVPDLIALLRERRLTDRDLAMLINYILWHGPAEEAARTLDQLGEMTTDASGEIYIEAARLLFTCIYPGRAGSGNHRKERMHRTENGSSSALMYFKGASFLADVLTRSGGDHPVRSAEEILRFPQLDDTTIFPKALALLGLIFNDEPERAASWCHALLSEARSAPTWHTLLSGIRAMVDLQLGDFISAEEHACTALARIPPESAGIALGGPLASSLLAEAVQGKYRQAAEHLRLPVPDTLFETLYGPRYLHARGRYHLSVNNLPAALADFQSCGEFTTRWQMEFSSVVPWRVDAAHTLLQMGDVQQARELGNEQLARLTPDQLRLHGMCVRILGITGDLKDRLMLLQRAAESLRKAGDRFELACTIADLSDAYQILGEKDHARIMARKAMHLAKKCGAEPLMSRISSTIDVEERGISVDKRLLADLSDAERRVAVLAAEGYTNRQISRRLHITVSTVEQHLTRVYRKLRVTRRVELPQELDSA